MLPAKKYDVIIIGSGLGGLLCANILALKGLKVCVLEKNKQFGGNLQTFARDKQIFDTGVHYIGGLEKGQTLYQIFKYVGLMERLKLEKMEECFDKILIGEDANIYCQAQGYESFIKHLTKSFPEEEDNIISYCDKVKEICASFPLYNLMLNADASYKGNNESAEATIASITNNKKLQAILAGNNLLYAGEADTTPFHVHALITNSYIESSWKCVGGGSQIAKILVANIRKHGGEIFRNREVIAISERDGMITDVTIADGEILRSKYFISNMHPPQLLRLLLLH
ncbi:phytoene desaturase family protein [Niabella ginsengisoli]|uniref:NAD(P)/FAD-dependent oxidoreductase n=1 Tax=Niabella ginsengisoli TaxID=522298 RepID=A0ABS9SNY2_9BACT|nr:NAD(P)/FAD-dependent oxidoreductase [Niabella ginsengisoli]MCH5600077.1 NAD(P)/FAD-dependent oxidoreductase [Niabella ginsengisoli]